MKLYKPFYIHHKLISFVSFMLISSLTFAETQPGDACSNNGSIMKSNANNEAHSLICNGATWSRLYSFDTSGQVGFHTSAENIGGVSVNGEVKIGESTGLACNSTTEGAVRYNSSSKNIDVCDGTDWSTLNTPCDNSPDSFTFPDEINSNPNITDKSRTVLITGLTCDTDVSVSGSYNPEYRICSNLDCDTVVQSWTSSTRQVSNNQYIQARLDTESGSLNSTSMTITVGDKSDTYTVTTKEVPASYKNVFKLTRRNGNLGGIAGANSSCNSAASSAGLSGTYKAWLATSASDDPESTFTKSTDPYHYTNGRRMAHNWTDLTDGSTSIRDFYADGSEDPLANSEWSGVKADGTAVDTGDPLADNCNGWTSGSSSHEGTYYSWWGNETTSSCNNNKMVLCFEQ